MLKKKIIGPKNKIQIGTEYGMFSITVGKQCYTKLKLYSKVSGNTMTSIAETAIEEFFSKSEWEEMINNYILTNLDNGE